MSTKTKFLAAGTVLACGLLIAPGLAQDGLGGLVSEQGAESRIAQGSGQVLPMKQPNQRRAKRQARAPLAKSKARPSGPKWAMPVKAPKWRAQVKDPQNRPGLRIHPVTGAHRCHQGLDLTVKHGTPIRASANGKATVLPFNGGAGNTVRISHGKGMQSHYFHLSEFHKRFQSRKTRPVRRGDVIGYVGTTGMSTGPHLHIEVTRHGKPRDPRHWLVKGARDKRACPKEPKSN